MNRKRWHAVGWFAAGTFFGGFVLNGLLGILKKVGL